MEFHISENKCCPDEKISFAGGNVFLRGSAGVGIGYQMNFQKRIDSSFTDLRRGWDFSAGRAWGVTGLSIDAGISASAQVVKYLREL